MSGLEKMNELDQDEIDQILKENNISPLKQISRRSGDEEKGEREKENGEDTERMMKYERTFNFEYEDKDEEEDEKEEFQCNESKNDDKHLK